MGFDLKLLWNFPIGILRLATIIIGGVAAGLISAGYHSSLEKEAAAHGIITFCCVGSAVIAATLVSGVIDVSSKKIKKCEFIFAIAGGILVLIAGILMILSVVNDRIRCPFSTKEVTDCQKSYGLSIAGAALSIFNSLIYGFLSYYLTKKL